MLLTHCKDDRMDYHTICEILRRSDKHYSSLVGKPVKKRQLVPIPKKYFVNPDRPMSHTILIKNTSDKPITLKRIVSVGAIQLETETGYDGYSGKIINKIVVVPSNGIHGVSFYIEMATDDEYMKMSTHGIFFETDDIINSVFVPVIKAGINEDQDSPEVPLP